MPFAGLAPTPSMFLKCSLFAGTRRVSRAQSESRSGSAPMHGAKWCMEPPSGATSAARAARPKECSTAGHTPRFRSWSFDVTTCDSCRPHRHFIVRTRFCTFSSAAHCRRSGAMRLLLVVHTQVAFWIWLPARLYGTSSSGSS